MSLDAASLFGVTSLVAVITGGGTGIGLMMARALALNGAHKVYIVGRRHDALAAAAASVSNGTVIPLVADVTSKESLAAAAQTVRAETGYVNLVVANAGVVGPASRFAADASIADIQAALLQPDVDAYLQTFAVNVAGPWLTLAAFLDLLDAGNARANVPQKSQFVATASVAALHRSNTGMFAYHQSKVAVVQMIKQMSTAMHQHDIRFNAIAPGYYPSEMTTDMLDAKATFPKDQVPLGRAGSEEDMAGVILFLASKAGAYCNGNILVTDGGRVAVMNGTY